MAKLSDDAKVANLRGLLEAHLDDDAGPHSIKVCAENGLRAVALAERLLREAERA